MEDFPLHLDQPGITLRDYFAAKAMQGMFANERKAFLSAEEKAKAAYEMADRMLEARK